MLALLRTSPPGAVQRLSQAVLGVFLGSLAFANCVHAAPPISEDQGRGATARVDDVLRVEGLGMAAFSPDGRWLAYNVLPPYSELADYSYWVHAGGLSGHRLWLFDLASDGEPFLQPGLEEGASSFLVGFSPDGRHVVTLEHQSGRLRPVACLVGAPGCTRFEAMPDIRDRYVSSAPWNERLVWVSGHRFVMPTRPASLPGSEMRSRATTGRYLWQEWQKAWAGDEPTAHEVISTARDRSNDWDSGDLLVFDLETGAESVLTPGRFAGVRRSPDGSWLAAARVGQRQQPRSDADLTPDQTHPMFDRRYALHLIDPQTGAARQAAGPFNVDPHSLTWSSDSSQLAVFGWEKDQSAEEGAFYLLPMDTLEPERLDTAGFEIANARFRREPKNPIGPARTALLKSGLVVLARPSGSERFDWYVVDGVKQPLNLSRGLDVVQADLIHAGPDHISFMARDGAYRVSASSRPIRLPTDPAKTVSSLAYRQQVAHGWSNEFRFDADRIRDDFGPGGAVVTSDPEDGFDTEVIFFGDTPGGADGQRLALPRPGVKVLAASGTARAAVVSEKLGAASRLRLVREAGEPRELVLINSHLNALAHPERRGVTYELRDAEGETRQIDSCMMVPPGFRSDKSYPLVIEPYPIGVSLSCHSLADVPAARAMVPDLWTARGYVYIRPPIPLDLARTAEGPIAGMPSIVEQTIDALVAQGIADPSRVVLFGYSQGGITALYTAARTRKISAVIAMNGWADFLSHYFGGRGLMRYFHLDQNGGDDRWRYDCLEEGAAHRCPFGFGATPFEAPGDYVRNSPVVLARDISAPVLLIHSDLDYVAMSQFDEMFGALYRAGKEARYVRYWGEGHGPSSPANVRDLWSRIDSFLSEHMPLSHETSTEPLCSREALC